MSAHQFTAQPGSNMCVCGSPSASPVHVDPLGDLLRNVVDPALVEAADQIVALRAELSALKARRCDGCAHYVQPVVLHANVPAYGACSLPSTESAEMEIAGGLHAETEIELLVDADHSCAAWTEKP